jgi:hypothetical protein
MPTVSWIRESAEDRYFAAMHEKSVPSFPAQPPACPHCAKTFRTTDLAEHIRVAHPMLRPILIIGGHPAPTEVIIRRRSSKLDLHLINTSRSTAEIDGADACAVSRETLLRLLETGIDSTITLQLTNTRAVDNASAHSAYKIKTRVPTEKGVRYVDDTFREILAREEISRADVDLFADRAKGHGADEYADGLYHYAVGLRAKDHINDNGNAISYTKYVEKFQTADAIVSEIPSPLADTISTCIRFNLNEFALSRRSTGIAALDEAISFFAPLTDHVAASVRVNEKIRKGTSVPACPIDRVTNAVLQLVVDVPRPKRLDQSQVDTLKGLIVSGLTSVLDRAKLRALLARRALDCGAPALAIPELRSLSHDPTFGPWATNQLNNVGDS